MKWYSNIKNFLKYILIQPKLECLVDHIREQSELAATLKCFKQIGWADMYEDETFAFYVHYNRTNMGREKETKVEGFIGTFPVFIKENTFPAFKKLYEQPENQWDRLCLDKQQTGGADD